MPWLACTLLSACMGDVPEAARSERPSEVLTLHIGRGPVAVGGVVTAGVGLACPDGQTCQPTRGARAITIEKVAVDDGSVFEIAPEPESSAFRLRALRDGTTRLHVSAVSRDASGYEVRSSFDQAVFAATADRVVLNGSPGCMTPLLYGTASEFNIMAQLHRGPDALEGTLDPFPVTSDVSTFTRASSGIATFTSASTRGVGKIQSTLDPRDALDAEVFDAAQVTAVELWVDAREHVGALPVVAANTSFDVQVSLRVGDRSPCAESIRRDISVETPDVCAVPALTTTGRVHVSTHAAGICSVKVRVGSAQSTQHADVR